MKNNIKVILLTLLHTLIISIAQILLKFSSENFSLSLTQIYNFPLLGGVALYFTGAVILIYAFRIGELSVVYPITASGFVMIALLSIFFLNDSLSVQRWFGLGLITLGVATIGRNQKE